MANNFYTFKTNILDPICLKQYGFYDKLSEKEQKTLAPLVLMRWLSGTNNILQLILINNVVNPYIFSLFQHKKLLIWLLQLCSSGKKQKLTWNTLKNKKTTKIPNIIEIVKEYFNYNTKHALDALSLLSNEDIIEYAELLGRQPNEITQIKKELKILKGLI